MKKLPTILIHARGMMTPDETDFWQRLQYALNDLNFDLWLIGHYLAQEPMKVPLLRVFNGLGPAERLIIQHDRNNSWNACLPLARDIDEEKLLERERLWHGKEKDEAHIKRRRRALYYYKNFYTAALKIIQPTLTVIWNGHHPQEMILDQLARRCGCPVGYIERSPFSGTIHIDSQGVLAGTTIANQDRWHWENEVHQKYWHTVMEQVQTAYCNTKETWWDQPKTLGVEALRKKFKIPLNKKVILFAGQVDRDIQNILYSPLFDSNLDAFRWLCQQLADNEDVFIVGKHHPKSELPVQVYQQIVPKNGIWTEEASLEDCLSIADRVVAVNSTVLYESLMLGIPILSMGKSLLSGKGIAYEVNELTTDAHNITAWLEAKDFSERLALWLDFGAYLLSTDFYTMKPPRQAIGQQDAKTLAKRFVNMAISQSYLNFDAISFDSSLALFLEVPTQYDEIQKQSSKIHSLKLLAKRIAPQLTEKAYRWVKYSLR